jgi:hypothetical protein
MYPYFLTGRSHVDRPRETRTDQLPRRWNKPRNSLYHIAAAAVADRCELKHCDSKRPSSATVLRKVLSFNRLEENRPPDRDLKPGHIKHEPGMWIVRPRFPRGRDILNGPLSVRDSYQLSLLQLGLS